jgi:hypothetical protein
MVEQHTVTSTENWQEAERNEWRAIKLSPTEIKALQFFERATVSALLTKSDPSRTIVNKLG